MLLLSCFFGQGPQCKGMQDASPIRAHGISQARPPSLPVSCERASPNQASEAERTGHGSSKAEPQKPSSFPGKASNVTPGHVLKTSQAAQLLDGLTFTPEVLGVGSYGLVLHGYVDGVDMAVKFMVSNRHTERAAVQEMAVDAMPALAHPHICKSYDTRNIIITDALFDELEKYRERQLRSQGRRQWRLHRLPDNIAIMAQGSTGGSNSRNGNGCNASRVGPPGSAEAPMSPSKSSERFKTMYKRLPPLKCPATNGVERALRFIVKQPELYENLYSNPLHPLESTQPLAVLHEVLFRLGATTGQTVTLIVMEYCGKGTLARAIHRGVFAPCKAWNLYIARRALIRTASEVARALLHLHKSGIVHGDIKPGNVLLKASSEDRRGFTAKVGDFGLSHTLPVGATSLDTNTWGTPMYMSPEALLGHTSTSSDVWSFGVMLSEALTQQLPYGGIVQQGRLVMGIIDGSLKLTWPAVRAGNLNTYAPASAPQGAVNGLPGMSTASRLAWQYGLFFPATRDRSLNVNGGRGGGSISTLESVESGHATACTASTATKLTQPTTAVKDDVAGGGSPTANSVASAGSDGRDNGDYMSDSLERVTACLVHLGRRCTLRDPGDRPCFSEVLGELLDLEMVLKSCNPTRPATPATRAAAGGSGQSRKQSCQHTTTHEQTACQQQQKELRIQSRLSLTGSRLATTIATSPLLDEAVVADAGGGQDNADLEDGNGAGDVEGGQEMVEGTFDGVITAESDAVSITTPPLSPPVPVFGAIQVNPNQFLAAPRELSFAAQELSPTPLLHFPPLLSPPAAALDVDMKPLLALPLPKNEAPNGTLFGNATGRGPGTPEVSESCVFIARGST